ncbi:hypothetical protein P154DRAFT_125690 [Amniculicola lignicola CBS 123094]|uniref:Uncharacterized protein n=1 Tax=Amniculicola lignicola CBS 123094 TaxID=1392246 RepID=A0A6A5WPD0_9PLEO|nr:hypothetical protein P154DRAFT_125690 [Amniculicola lignicola CBS 123094]
MTLAYKVEELLALRDSVSESAVSIDKFADEEAIKEHVLRPSVSANVVGSVIEKPPRSSILPGVPGVPTLVASKKPSPSPSIKRGKAERLLKEHGSPPGMRVTAGGRVVPSDLPPLSTSRFGVNNYKPQGPGATSPGSTMAAPGQPDAGHPLQGVQVIGGQPVICFGDKLFALSALTPALTVPSVAPSTLDTSSSLQGGYNSVPTAAPSTTVPPAVPAVDVQALKQQQAFKKQELRNVEQTEVLQASQHTQAWREGIIAKKKSLILELDSLRRQIVAAEEPSKAATMVGPALNHATVAKPATAAPTPFVPQYQQTLVPTCYPNVGLPAGVNAPTQYQPVMMYHPYGGIADASQFAPDSRFFGSREPSINANPFPGPLTQVTTSTQSPGSASRRSHAIEIKPPRDEPKKQIAQGSTLDPKSPTYEPPPKSSIQMETTREFVPPTPSPAKRSLWRPDDGHSYQFDNRANHEVSREDSFSSIDTADFFPTNTHEHSSTRMAPNKIADQKPLSQENTGTVATPEKAWQGSPWDRPLTNSAKGGLSKRGSQPSSANKSYAGPGSASASLRKNSPQPMGIEQTWPLAASKPVKYIPSTYQEGYQAGYEHVGLPDSFDVLRGFLEGLQTYLKDQSRSSPLGRNLIAGRDNSTTSSLRVPLSALGVRDSGISMSFGLNSAPLTQENMRTASGGMMRTVASRASAFNPNYEFGNDIVQDISPREATAERTNSGYRPVSENTDYKQKVESQMRADVQVSSFVHPRSFSGNQLANRVTYGTPVDMQRYHPSSKQYGQSAFGMNVPGPRPSTNHCLSGLDGAMDDLAGLVTDTHIGDQESLLGATGDSGVSCFGSSVGKGKQKAPSSPIRCSTTGGTSPSKHAASPKKGGEHSPAKVKLEQMTNKFRRERKDDPRNMSPEEKTEHTEKWRKRFRMIRQNQTKEIDEYCRERDTRERDDRRRRNEARKKPTEETATNPS